MYKLEITVEGTWRGDILDTVKPVCTLSLAKSPISPSVFNLDPYFQLKLSNGDCVEIGCSWTKSNDTGLRISRENGTLLNLETKGEYRTEMVLGDGLQYQFKLTKGNA